MFSLILCASEVTILILNSWLLVSSYFRISRKSQTTFCRTQIIYLLLRLSQYKNIYLQILCKYMNIFKLIENYFFIKDSRYYFGSHEVLTII